MRSPPEGHYARRCQSGLGNHADISAYRKSVQWPHQRFHATVSVRVPVLVSLNGSCQPTFWEDFLIWKLSGGALGVEILNSATPLIQTQPRRLPMESMYYIGLDVHKKTISYCVKDGSGRIHAEGKIPATIFTGWIYDHLRPHAGAVKVAHPLMLRAIAAAKKKNDRIDAKKIADVLRCDFLPECYMAPTAIRERRRTLRYRNLLVRQTVQLKNRISGLLMEAGVSYNKQKLHKVGYFRELLKSNPDIDESLRPLLQLCRETLVRLQKTESALIRSLARDRLLVERVEHLMTIPAVGPITALTWALEVGEVSRFSSIKKAISYCGLCGDEQSSGEHVKRTPISKQRNKHLQWVLVEAAHMAPRLSPELALLYDREKQKGNTNRATLAVARKLVAYLVAIDRSQRDFLLVEKENQAAA